MDFQLLVTAVVWGTVLAVAASAALAWRQRPRRGATTFSITMLAATWWVVTASLGLFTTENPAMRLFWSQLEWGATASLPVAWLLFALAYTGREEYITPRNVALLAALPTVSLFLVFTNGAGHTLVYRSQEFAAYGSISLIHRTFGPWFWVHTVYSYLLLGAGAVLVFQLVVGRRLLYRGQATALLLVVAAPWTAYLAYVAGLVPAGSFDPTPYSMVISGVAGLAALTQFRFLDAVPVTDRVAHRSVVANVDAGVLVTDTDDRIVEVNPRARTLLECGESKIVGDHLSSWVPLEAGSIPGDGEREVVTYDRGSGTHYYEIQVTEMRDGYGTLTGRILLIQDVTARRTRLQRLNVLNRVLRHNLRNEMNVVYGFAEQLDRDDADPDRVADDIRGKARELVELGEKAREIDDFLAGGPNRTPTDLATVLGIERDRLVETYPDAVVDFESDLPSVDVPGVVGTIVRNLAENAVEHNAAATPRVEIDVSIEGDRVRISIADDGPGIPSAERAALEGDTETQLDHASGLGLWLTRWAVDSVGGSIAVADRDPTGTRVTVELPRLDVGSDSDSSDGPSGDRRSGDASAAVGEGGLAGAALGFDAAATLDGTAGWSTDGTDTPDSTGNR